MKKVLIISYYWPPSGGAGVQRWLKMAKYLPDYGVKPFVLTVDESFASYPLIDRSFLDEVSDETEVYRTKSFEPLRIYGKIFGKKKVPYSGFTNVKTDNLLSKMSRWVRGNMFIPDARKGWNKFALPKAREIVAREDIETIITTGPPHSTHFIGLALKKSNQSLHWIADFRDPWTDIYYYDNLLPSKNSRKKDAEMERLVLESSDRVLAVCPSNQRLFAGKLNKENGEKVKLLTNGFDNDDFKGIKRSVSNDRLELVYTGTLAEIYDVKPIFIILQELDTPWHLTVAGNVAPEICELIRELKIDQHMTFLGHVAHKESLQLLKKCHALLHILPNTSQAILGTTGKLFEYIGSGTPILNFGPTEGDSASFIKMAGAGESFERSDREGVLQFLRFCFENRDFSNSATNQFSRKNITGKLVDLLQEFEQ